MPPPPPVVVAPAPPVTQFVGADFFGTPGFMFFFWFSCYSSCLSLVISSTCTYVSFFSLRCSLFLAFQTFHVFVSSLLQNFFLRLLLGKVFLYSDVQSIALNSKRTSYQIKSE